MAKLPIADPGAPREARQAPRANLPGPDDALVRQVGELAQMGLQISAGNKARQESLEEKMDNARVTRESALAKANALEALNDMAFRAKQVKDPTESVKQYDDDYNTYFEALREQTPDAAVWGRLEPYIISRRAYDSIGVRENAYNNEMDQGRAASLKFNAAAAAAAAENPAEMIQQKANIIGNMAESNEALQWTDVDTDKIVESTFDQMDEAHAWQDMEADARLTLGRLQSRVEDPGGDPSISPFSFYPDLDPEKRVKMQIRAQNEIDAQDAEDARLAAAAAREDDFKLRDYHASNIKNQQDQGRPFVGAHDKYMSLGASKEEADHLMAKSDIYGHYKNQYDALITAPLNEWRGIIGEGRSGAELGDEALVATEVQARQDLIRASSGLFKQMENDAAQFVFDTREAPEGMTPESQIEWLKEEYNRQEIPLQWRKPLTLGQMEKEVGSYTGAMTYKERHEVAVSIFQDKYGENTSEVVRQLIIDGKLPWSAALMAEANGRVGAILMRMEESSLTRAKLESTFITSEIKTIKEGSNKHLEPFISSLSPLALQRAEYRRLTQEYAMHLAIGNMSPEDAGQEAVKQLFGGFEYQYTNGFATRVPLSIPADLRERIPFHEEQIKASVLDAGPIIDPRLSSEQFKNEIMQNGYFLTNEQGDGAYLYHGGIQILDRGGRPIEYKWTDASETPASRAEISKATIERGVKIVTLQGVHYTVTRSPKGPDFDIYKPAGQPALAPGVKPPGFGVKLFPRTKAQFRGIPGVIEDLIDFFSDKEELPGDE